MSLVKIWGTRWFALTFYLLTTSQLGSMPQIAPDWQGREPTFEPGSLFWRTREFTASPVLYRTVLTIPAKPLDFAAARIQTSRYAYLFATRFDRFSDLDPLGKLIAKGEAPKERPDAEIDLLVDLTPIVAASGDSPEKPSQLKIALLLSAPSEGFRMEGVLVFRDGSVQIFGSEPNRWRAQKFPPLTVLEFEPCMLPNFDDRNWFPVRIVKGATETPKSQLVAEFRKFVSEERKKWLRQQLNDARWRLTLLRDKGIVIVDDEAFGWAGSGRLPEWVRESAEKLLQVTATDSSEQILLATEALSLFVWASDEVTNLDNHVKLWRALRQPERAQKCQHELSTIAPLLRKVEKLLHLPEAKSTKELAYAIELLRELRQRTLALRHPDIERALIINDLNSGLENKFGWFDTTILLDNDINRWGLRISTPAT
ncbi:MAG: hypothetical protein ACK40X_02695, partial [Armatimonadota bacterium]